MMQEVREDFQSGAAPYAILGKLMCILEVQQAHIRALEQVAHGHKNALNKESSWHGNTK